MTYPRKDRRVCQVPGCYRLLSNHFKKCVRCGTCTREGRRVVENGQAKKKPTKESLGDSV